MLFNLKTLDSHGPASAIHKRADGPGPLLANARYTRTRIRTENGFMPPLNASR
jgi:hypothetical protein